MLNLFDERTISGHFLSYLINGDDSGLDETEKTEFDDFMTHYNLDGLTCDVLGDESNFEQCDVTGLYSDCYTVNFYKYEAKTNE